MSAPYSQVKDVSIGAKPIAYSNGDVIPATLWDSVVSLQDNQASALTRLTRQEQFYQVTNVGGSTNVNEKPTQNSGDSFATLNGLASDASNWLRFDSWYAPGNTHDTNYVGAHPLATNTDPNMFETVSQNNDNYGVKCKVAGYYKITCNMLFYSFVVDVAVAVRFSRNGLNDDIYGATSRGPWQLENPASIGVSAYVSNGTFSNRRAMSVSISEIIYCAENDILAVHTSRAGQPGIVNCRPLSCQLIVEYKGPSS